MPRDLFGDVTHPSVSVGARKWYTVPLSLAAHVSVLVAIVFASLVAQEFVPLPREVITFVGPVTIPTPPPPPLMATATTHTPPPNRDAAPTEAPTGITPDDGIERPRFEDLGTGVATSVIPGAGDAIVADVLVAPPPPKPQAPVRVGDKIKMPAKVRDVWPIYPPLAQAARMEGVVILEALLGEDGKVRNLRVLRSVPLLDQAALDAVRQWEYTPTLLNGVPVSVIMTVTVTFKLNR